MKTCLLFLTLLTTSYWNNTPGKHSLIGYFKSNYNFQNDNSVSCFKDSERIFSLLLIKCGWRYGWQNLKYVRFYGYTFIKCFFATFLTIVYKSYGFFKDNKKYIIICWHSGPYKNNFVPNNTALRDIDVCINLHTMPWISGTISWEKCLIVPFSTIKFWLIDISTKLLWTPKHNKTVDSRSKNQEYLLGTCTYFIPTPCYKPLHCIYNSFIKCATKLFAV